MPIDYLQYIRSSPNWQRLRARVLVRARGLCERCRCWPIVAVHHRTYERLGAEWLEDLYGVCQRCHNELHGKECSDE
jgi:hypothetical protein